MQLSMCVRNLSLQIAAVFAGLGYLERSAGDRILFGQPVGRRSCERLLTFRVKRQLAGDCNFIISYVVRYSNRQKSRLGQGSRSTPGVLLRFQKVKSGRSRLSRRISSEMTQLRSIQFSGISLLRARRSSSRLSGTGRFNNIIRPRSRKSIDDRLALLA